MAPGIVAVLLARQEASCRTPREFTLLRSAWTSAALGAFVVTYGVGRFVLTPLIERL